MADNENIKPATLSSPDSSDYGLDPGYPALPKQTQLSGTAVQDFAPNPTVPTLGESSSTHHQAHLSLSDLSENAIESERPSDDDSSPIPRGAPSSSRPRPSAVYPTLSTLSIPQGNTQPISPFHRQLPVPGFHSQPDNSIASPPPDQRPPAYVSPVKDEPLRRMVAQLLERVNDEEGCRIPAQYRGHILHVISGWHTEVQQREAAERQRESAERRLGQVSLDLAACRTALDGAQRRLAEANANLNRYVAAGGATISSGLVLPPGNRSQNEPESPAETSTQPQVQPALEHSPHTQETQADSSAQTSAQPQVQPVLEHSPDTPDSEKPAALKELCEALSSGQTEVLTPNSTLRKAVGESSQDARLAKLFTDTEIGPNNFRVGKPPQQGIAPIYGHDVSMTPSPTSPQHASGAQDFTSHPQDDIISSSTRPMDIVQRESPANRPRKKSLLSNALHPEATIPGTSGDAAIRQGVSELGGVMLPTATDRGDDLVSPFTRLPEDNGVSLTTSGRGRAGSDDSDVTLVPVAQLQHAREVAQHIPSPVEEGDEDWSKNEEDRKDSGTAGGEDAGWEEGATQGMSL